MKLILTLKWHGTFSNLSRIMSNIMFLTLCDDPSNSLPGGMLVPLLCCKGRSDVRAVSNVVLIISFTVVIAILDTLIVIFIITAVTASVKGVAGVSRVGDGVRGRVGGRIGGRVGGRVRG